MSSAAIGRRVDLGFLRTVHPGVYTPCAAPLTRPGQLMAAVLFLGEKSVISHRAAMSYHCLGDWNGFPELTVPGPRRSRAGLIVHRATLPPDEVTIRDGIPITKPSRTLFDLAAVLGERGLRRALNEAAYLRLPLSPSLPALIERHPRRHGIATLRRILAEGRIGLERTESDFEDEVREWLAGLDLPPAVHQFPVEVAGERYRLDVAWPDLRIAVEIDTPDGHDHPEAIERDKRRDRHLAAAGWIVIRVTARAFELEPDLVEADLRAALAARATAAA